MVESKEIYTMPNIDEILKKIEGQNISFIQEFYSFCENKKRLMSLSNLIVSIFPVKHINNLLVTDMLLWLLTLPVLPLVIMLVFCCRLFRSVIDVNESENIRFQSLVFFLIFLLFWLWIYLLIFGWSLGIAFILWWLFASYYLMSFRLLFIKEWTTYYISRLEYCHKQLFYFFIDSNFELFSVVEHVKLINSACKSVKNIDRVLYIFNIALLQNIRNSRENLSWIRVHYLWRIEKPTEEIMRDQLIWHLRKEYSYLHEQLIRINTSLQQTIQKYIIFLQHNQFIVSHTLSRDETLIRVAQLQNQRLEQQIEQFSLISEKLLQISQLKLPNI